MKALYFLLLISLSTFAHEGAEVPSAKYAAKYGGRVAFVAHDHDKKFVAEMIISDDNKVRLYVYDMSMKQIDLKDFPAVLKGEIVHKKKKLQEITLNKDKQYYLGNFKPVKKKPYHLNFEFSLKGEPLHIEFQSMD